MKELEDVNKKIQEENELLRLKSARMQEIGRFFIGNQQRSTRTTRTTRSTRSTTRSKRRETWNPSDIKKLTSSSSVGLSMMGAVSAADDSMNDSLNDSGMLDESCDLSMTESELGTSRQSLGGVGHPRFENHTIDIASLGANLGRFSFGGDNGGNGGNGDKGGSGGGSGGGSMAEERRNVLRNARRRVSFGGSTSSSLNLHSEVIRAKGAKISSQDLQISRLNAEVAALKVSGAVGIGWAKGRLGLQLGLQLGS